MIIETKVDENSRLQVKVRLVDGFYWVTVHKEGKLVYENRHLYEETALADADSKWYQGKLYAE